MDATELQRREEIKNARVTIEAISLPSVRAVLAAQAVGVSPDPAALAAVLDAERQLYSLRVELAALDGDDLPPEPDYLTNPVPSITKAQLVLWLAAHGKSDTDVDTAIASIEDAMQRAAAAIEWKYRERFHHDHPLVVMLAPMVGIEVGDLPNAFRTASLL